jgi:RNA polymerase sigma-70 factor (ECF subfamily)
MAIVPLRNPSWAAATPRHVAAVPAEDAALVAAVMAGQPWARTELFDRHGPHVQRVLARILGHDAELADLLHEVFVRALAQMARLDDPSALKAWLTAIAVFTAREHIRRRARGRWLRLFAHDDLPDVPAHAASEEIRESLRATYDVLDRLGVEDRIAFALRYIDGLELGEVAAACNVSLSTIKRRLVRAEKRFFALARKEPALDRWLEGGTRCDRA